MMSATVRVPQLPYGELQLALQNLEHPIDTRLTERTEPPQKRTADADRFRAERQRLEHVGAAPHAAVDEHRNAIADFGDDFRQRFDRRASRFRRSAAAIRLGGCRRGRALLVLLVVGAPGGRTSRSPA